jgi:cobalt/nickel transport system permease protein
MHIPDGYISPATCLATYGISIPFWYAASRRVKKLFRIRMVPLLSVFSAFSFVIMLFNLPIPGGTTAHAVGVGIAAIVLGPSASILAVSVALFIQAVFFGDGGVTTFGANCFNMAIVGSLVAYGTYRLIATRAPVTSSRRVVAGAAAGYLAINVSALCAAIEFGIQPLLYKDAAGTPLYCPYPLSVTIPAMMIGHMTFAGLAELVVSGGLVAYLQKANPSLLTRTAPKSPLPGEGSRAPAGTGRWRGARPLWAAVALLLILTPLGILAAGAGWGEWAARDFSNPAVRQQMTASSRNVAPPEFAPRGLERLSSVWAAPFPQYAPRFIRSPAFGYLLSAMVGTGASILLCLLAGLLFWPAPASKLAPGSNAGAS